MKRAFLLAAVVAMAAPGAAGAVCSGAIDAASTVISGKQYDPFSAKTVADQYTIRIANRSGEACDFALVFSAPPATRQLGGTIPYALTDPGGRALIVPAPPSMPPMVSLTTSHVSANATTDLAFMVNIDRGVFAAPGRYADNLTLTLYSVENSQFKQQDTKPLSLAYTVPQILSVTVGKADTNWTLNFGELAQGAQRSVSLHARSNVSYRFGVSSDHLGHLTLDPPLAGQVWTVPYAVAVDSQAVDLSKPVSTITVSAPPTPIAGDSHALAVTIGDVSKKRAGIYRDVITVEITAALP